MSWADAEIAGLAALQHGVVAAWQLLARGVSRTVIRRRVADGRLRRLHRGVYAVGQVGQRGRWLAAVLALGPRAMLSHRDAAALHGLRESARETIDVTVAGRPGRRRGIDVHGTRAIHPDDRLVVDAIPVTSIARTLLDLASLLSPTHLRRAYEKAEELRVLDVNAINELLDRSSGRRGAAALRALIGYDPTPAAEARSELELRFLDLIREAGLPTPRVNVLVEGFVVDAYWPDARLVVELQSHAHHSDRETFKSDHVRIARLKLAGHEVLALTWHQVTEESGWVADAISALLARGRAALAGHVRHATI